MKKILCLILILGMISGIGLPNCVFSASSSEIQTSERGYLAYGVETVLNGETVKQFTVGTNNYSNILNEDKSNGRKITDAIVDFELMLSKPVSTGTPYVFFTLATGKDDGTGTKMTYDLFQFWNPGVREREGLTNALGIATSNAHLNSGSGSMDDTFAITYDTWNRIRVVFSSTNNTIKVYHKDACKTYTFNENAPEENNVWKFLLNFKCTGGVTGDKMYLKNVKSYYTFSDASDADKLVVANEDGEYAYSYNDNSGVFSYKTNYKYGTYPVTATVTGFKDALSAEEGYQLPRGEEFTMPSYIDGYPVVEIGEFAFSKNDSNENVSTDSEAEDGRYFGIKKINMPETLKIISKYAFHAMHGLKYIELPENLETIGDGAFKNCFSVNEIKINDKLKKIGANAFYKLGNLNTNFTGSLIKDSSHKVKRIDIPKTVTSIGGQAFNNTQVDTIIFHGDISTTRAMFIWLNANHLVFRGNVTTDGGNPFAHYSNDSNVTTWRTKKLYCSDNVNAVIQPLIEAVDSQPGYAYNGHSTAWIDSSNNKAYLMSGSAEVFTASYNNDGSLAWVSDITKINANESVNLESDVNADFTKAFVWNSTVNGKPLVSCEFLKSKVDLFLIGDSICQEYTDSWYPRQGWGSYFTNNTSDYFEENFVTVHNYSKSGWSTNHFLKQYTAGASSEEKESLMNLLESNPNNVWKNILPNIGKGDYVIVALGINDNSSSNPGRNTEEVYKANLRKFAEDTRTKGAETIFMTPSPQGTPLRNGGATGITNAWSARGKMVKEVAIEIGAVCLDFGTEATSYYNLVAQKYNQNIPEGMDASYGNLKVAKEFYLSRDVLLTPISEDGWGMSESKIESGSLNDLKASGKGYDDTHTSEKGAKTNAEIICKLIKASKSGLAKYCK